jgi:phage major head subunit gpT-like protein
MATPITSNQITNLTSTQVQLRAVFFDQLQAVNEPGSDLMQFFKTGSSRRATEYSQGVGGFGDIPEYQGTLQYSDFELLYRKTYTHVEYAQGVAVTRKALDDDGYGVLAQRARLLGIAFNRSVYKNAASVFNSATSTAAAYVGGDGKALVADDHPRSSTDATTQDNKGTTALSVDSLIAAEIAMMGFTDSEGNPSNIMPDTLVVPLALKHTAETIIGSTNKSGTANNDKNTLSGYNLVVSRYLTDANNWFLIDSTMAREYLNWYWHTMPEFTESPDSDYNLVAKYRGYMRYSFGFDNWQWIYGGIVA